MTLRSAPYAMWSSDSVWRATTATAFAVCWLGIGVGRLAAQTSDFPPTHRSPLAGSPATRTPIQRDSAVTPTPARPAASPWGTLVILGGIVAVVVIGGRLLKRAAPQRFGGLSAAAIDLLGSCPVTPQTALHVVRIGERVLVLGSGSEGLRTLMEVTDPAEASQLVQLCRTESPQRSAWNPLRRRSDGDTGTGTPDAASPVRATRSSSTIAKAAVWFLCATVCTSTAWAQDAGVVPDGPGQAPSAAFSLSDFTSPQSLGPSLRLGLLLGVLSLAPAILLMTTCYVRINVVLGLLRQALGVQQFPPTQVLTALSLFLTALVMWPTWERCYREGVEPYAASAAAGAAGEAELRLALTRTAGPLRQFMSRQIELTGNVDALDMLMSYQTSAQTAKPQASYYEDVPLQVLLPAYVLSELKTAFLIGFQVYLPFVVIDLVVTSVLASLGLGMLPPGVVSLPFKLLLFVLIDGWFLVVESLLQGLR